MANGNGNGNGNGITGVMSPAKLLTLFMTMIVISNGVMFWAIDKLDDRITERSGDRYYKRDADAHAALIDQRFSNIEFRFSRNEEKIQECHDYMKEHDDDEHSNK